MIVVPPPDSVPIVDAPPPMSEPSPTTTPAEIRPSIIDAPSVPGVVVDEALVHHRRALGEVGAEPDAVGVGDPHAARGDVVRHARELVDRRDRERLAGGAEAQPHRGQVGRQDRAVRGPGDVGQDAEDAGQVGLVRAGSAGARAGAGAGRRPARRRAGRRASRSRSAPARCARRAARPRRPPRPSAVGRRAGGPAPSRGSGYQVSSTVSPASVASPCPHAPSCLGVIAATR